MGLWVIFNYGYIVGYGVESLMGYGVINYGEVVVIGMEVVVKIVYYLGFCD